MKQSRAIAALCAMAGFVLAAPAGAQDAPASPVANTPAPATNTADTIGPAQLRDFSLNGTVTREAPQPAAIEPRPATSASSEARRADSAPPASARSAAAERPSRVTTSGSATESAPARSVAFDLPPPTQVDEPTPASVVADPLVQPTTDMPADSGFAMTGGLSILPWLLAALAAGFGLWFFGARQRNRYAFAGASAEDSGLTFAAPEPAPKPLQRAMPEARPVPAAPPPATGGGIVSTRLRPWLDLELIPGRAVFGEAGMTIEFDLSVRNSGAAPARDVLIEAAMFNAGPDQEQQIAAFHAHPETRGDRLSQIQPLQKVVLKSAVTLPLAEMRQFEVGGRKLFVPLLAVNAIYRWSAGEGQTSASYLIGRDGKGEKMAPLRLDLGPRLFRGLGAREHTARVRK